MSDSSAHWLLVFSGNDSNTRHTCSGDRHGERRCHGGRLPARCQLRRRRGDAEVDLCHSGRQRGSVLLDAGGGHRQSRAEEGDSFLYVRQVFYSDE